MFSKEIYLLENVWVKFNIGWVIFFIICMFFNFYVSYFMLNDVWYIFKVFGLIGLSLVVMILMGVVVYFYL